MTYRYNQARNVKTLGKDMHFNETVHVRQRKGVSVDMCLFVALNMCGSRGGTGVRTYPLENHKNRVFFSKTGMDPLEKSQSYQASFHCRAIVGPLARRQFRWWADDDPLLKLYGASAPPPPPPPPPQQKKSL